MRMIDADALPEHKFPEILCNKFGDGAFYRQGWNDAIDAIVDNEDTVDVVPVVHGRWIPCFPLGDGTPEGYMCSVCRVGGWEKTNFCPHCGARNIEGDDET